MGNLGENKLRLRDIISKNLILIICMQMLADCGNGIITAFVTLGAKDAGISLTAIGIASSLSTLGMLLLTMPAGKLTNSTKKKMIMISIIGGRVVLNWIGSTWGFSGTGPYYITRVALGAIGGCSSVVIPAVAAMVMDKKALGTTMAVYSVLTSLSKSYMRALGLSLYQNYGVVTTLAVGSVFAVASCIVVLFIDFKDPKLNVAPRRRPGAKGGIFEALDVRFIPICLLMCMAAIPFTLNGTYTTILADVRGLDMVTVLAITGTIAAFWRFGTSALCDLIDPKYVLALLFAMMGGGMILLGYAETQSLFTVAAILGTLGGGYTRVLSVYLYKNCKQEEKGTVLATNLFVTNIFTTIAGTLCGVMIDQTGYTFSYVSLGVVALVSAVCLLLFGTRLMHLGSKESEVTEQA